MKYNRKQEREKQEIWKWYSSIFRSSFSSARQSKDKHTKELANALSMLGKRFEKLEIELRRIE